DKVKTGLDETRLLILGAQVLFGFQLNVVFQEGFARLNPATRLIDSVAQGLMAIAIGLLIAPSMHHLIAEKGQDTLRLHRATGLFAGFALLPFAISLGLSFYIVFDRLYDRGCDCCGHCLLSAGVAFLVWNRTADEAGHKKPA